MMSVARLALLDVFAYSADGNALTRERKRLLSRCLPRGQFFPGRAFFRPLSRADSIKLIRTHGAASTRLQWNVGRLPRRRALGVRAELARASRCARGGARRNDCATP